MTELEAATKPEEQPQKLTLRESLLTKSAWDEKETGEFVHCLAAEYNEAMGMMKPVEAFNSLEQGVRIAATKCPVGNKPWLFHLLEKVQTQPEVVGPVCDQRWHEEETARWWFK